MANGADDPFAYAAPRTSMPKKPMGRITVALLLAFCLIGGLSLWMFAYLPYDLTKPGPDGNASELTVLRPAWRAIAEWSIVPGFLLPLAAGILLLIRRRILTGSLLVIAILPLTLASLWKGFMGDLAPWVPYDSVVAPDGVVYYFVDSSFLQGQEMALAREKSRSLFYTTMDVLGTTNGDSPRSFLLVVRPDPPKAVPYGALYATPSGHIVGLRQDRQCYLVYDTATKRFYGHGDVEKLSPFLLINGTNAPSRTDELQLAAAIRAGEQGAPSRNAVEDARADSNPAVRESANRILSALPP